MAAPPGKAEAGYSSSGQTSSLNELIEKSQLECLNESDDHPVSMAFDGSTSTYLQSDPDTDDQLLISVGFRSPVKISHVKVNVPAEEGDEDCTPTKIKIFLGGTDFLDSLDFDTAESTNATQEFENVTPGQAMEVKFVKFQNVQNMRIFVAGSKGGVTTKISGIQFIGQSAEQMDMKAWKPVKG